MNDNQTEAYKEAISLCKTNQVIIDTFEISHPSITLQDKNLYIGLVIDNTGSMSSEINTIKTSLPKMVEGIVDSGEFTNVYFYIATFKDEGETRFLSGSRTRWLNVEQVVDALDLIVVGGGGDTPENGFGAIVETVNSVKWGYGLDSKRMVILISDTGSHERVSTRDYAQALLLQKDIVFCYGHTLHADGGDNLSYEPIATATEGVFIEGLDPANDALVITQLVNSFVFPEPEPPLYLTSDNQDHDLLLEDDATLVTFKSVGLRHTPISPSSEGITSITFAIDNTDRQILNYINRVKNFPTPLRCLIRPYIIEGNTKTRGLVKPEKVFLSNFVITTTEVQASASFTDLVNPPFPRQDYTSERFSL